MKVAAALLFIYLLPLPSEAASRWWKLSSVALAVANAVDIHSSYRCPQELNPVFRNGQGRFGTKGLSLKIAITGGILSAQYLALQRKPEWEPAMTFFNTGFALQTAWIARRNYQVSTTR